MGGGNVIVITDKEVFDGFLAKSKDEKKIVIVDFSAVWCAPCQMIAPLFAQLSEKYPHLIFLKVDVDEVESVAAACGISAMPTFQIYANGEKAEEFVGASKDKLVSLVEKYA